MPQIDSSLLGFQFRQALRVLRMLRKFRYRMRWYFSLLPSIFLIPLVFVPIDFITATLWLLAFIFFLFSLVMFGSWWLRVNKPISDRAPKMMRWVLCMLVIIVCHRLVLMSVDSATTFALTKSIEIQNKIETGGICPMQLSNFENSSPSHYNEPRYQTKYGTFGTKYWITYRCEADFFDMRVRVNKDEDYWISGGKDKNLTVKFGPYFNNTSVVVDKQTDLEKLAKRKI